MKNGTLKLCEDINRSIESIGIHLKTIDGFSSYKDNLTVKRAVERELEIIGEAVKRLSETKPDTTVSDARKIIALRNRIIHGYDTIDDEIIWGIVQKSIPALKKDVERIVSAEEIQ